MWCHIEQHKYRIVPSSLKVLLDNARLYEIKSKVVSLIFKALNSLAPFGLSQFISRKPFPCTLSSNHITQLYDSQSYFHTCVSVSHVPFLLESMQVFDVCVYGHVFVCVCVYVYKYAYVYMYTCVSIFLPPPFLYKR